jgi:uncharacterized protein
MKFAHRPSERAYSAPEITRIGIGEMTLEPKQVRVVFVPMNSARRNRSTLLIAAMVGIAGLATHAAAQATEGPKLISRDGGGPKWKNVEELKQHAAKGDPAACFELGDRLMLGDGVPEDLQQARVMMEKAAQGGIADAWFRLGKIHHDALGVPRDYAKAFEYYTEAAKRGVPEAQHNIGAMLVSARGVKRDYVEGLAWLIVAGKSGAMSTAEQQVRKRLEKRPQDIKAAEARAQELMKDLTKATPAAVTKDSAPATSRGGPQGVPPPKLEAPKKVEIAAPPKLSFPTSPFGDKKDEKKD